MRTNLNVRLSAREKKKLDRLTADYPVLGNRSDAVRRLLDIGEAAVRNSPEILIAKTAHGGR